MRLRWFQPTGTLSDSISRAPRSWALLTSCILVAPILLAIWWHPFFVTQDGSIYLYNSHIILQSLKPNNPFRDHYSVRWLPLPYWGVYIILAALMSVFPERIADHLIVSITSVGLFVCILWLRRRVLGWDGTTLVVPLAVILSINTLWLIGLYNFLFGAGCYLVTLGVWWSCKDVLGLKPAILLAGLLICGYLCHPVSVSVTAFALVILSIATPGRWRRRALWTLGSILPLVPLLCFYRSLMQAAARSHPRWTDLDNVLSPRQWLSYARGANILLITDDEPDILFSHSISGLSHLPAITTWVILGVALFLISSFIRVRSQSQQAGNSRRGWTLLCVLLLLFGLFGPDDLGEAHGGFLRERMLLLGVATMIPILPVRLTGSLAQRLFAVGGLAALLIGCGLQLAAVWNYAQVSDRLAVELMMAKPYIGARQRVAALIDQPEDDYRAKPLLHLADLFGIDTGNVIWNNYGPGLYYFPIKFRDARNTELFHGPVFPEFTDPENEKDIDDWSKLISDIQSRTDVLAVWGGSPDLDDTSAEWFEDEPVFENDNVRVFKHR